jgi:hypothetical protein
MKNILLLALFTLTISGAAYADSATEVKTGSQNESPSAALEDIFAETKARLNLSHEQVEQVAPVLQSSFESRRAILLKYGIDIESRKPPALKLGIRKARALSNELKKVSSSTSRKLDDILTKEQMSEYTTMQNERQSEMRKRLRASR